MSGKTCLRLVEIVTGNFCQILLYIFNDMTGKNEP